MRAEQIVAKVDSLGGYLECCPPNKLSLWPRSLAESMPDLVAELREHKANLIAHLTGLDYQIRFGEPHARLFAYLGRSVGASSGRGVLVQVSSDWVAVVQRGRVVFCLPSEVEP